MALNPNPIAPSHFRLSTIWYFLKRGTTPLSLVLAVCITVDSSQYLDLYNDLVMDMGLPLLTFIALSISLGMSVIVCVIWGTLVEIITIGITSQTEWTAAISLTLSFLAGSLLYIVGSTLSNIVFGFVVMVASFVTLGFWTWRYWITLEPIEKKKKRG